MWENESVLRGGGCIWVSERGMRGGTCIRANERVTQRGTCMQVNERVMWRGACKRESVREVRRAHLRHNHFLGTIDDEIATLVELALTVLGRVFLHDLRPRQMTEPRLEHDRKVPYER
jgi:hypothetical protein